MSVAGIMCYSRSSFIADALCVCDAVIHVMTYTYARLLNVSELVNQWFM